MEMHAALTEFAYAKDHSPASRAWYKSRLGAFTAWPATEGTTNVEDLSAALIRRYIEYRRTTPTKHGTPLDSHTLHGHVRAIRAILNWAASDDLIDERIPKRVALPKREQDEAACQAAAERLQEGGVSVSVRVLAAEARVATQTAQRYLQQCQASPTPPHVSESA